MDEGESSYDKTHMDPETQRLVNLLKTTLRVLDISQRELARRLELSPSYVSKLFAGVSELRLDHIIRILRAAKVEPAEFFGLAYPRQPSRGSLAAAKLRELLQSIEFPPPPKTPAPELDEASLRAMLEKLLSRSGGTG